MVKKKAKSKRMDMLLKSKIRKRTNQHNARLRKVNGSYRGKKLRKDPGIPNLWPFKEQLIKEIRDSREAAADAKAASKAAARKAAEKKRRQDMVAMAGSRAMGHASVAEDNNESGFFGTSVQLKEQSVQKRHWYFKELKKVVDVADVIIEVLDARDPLGCRCPEMEKMALSRLNPDGTRAKRILLVINKIDLVPKEVTAKWIAHFKREFPTLGFKASTQQQGRGLSQARGRIDEARLNVGACVGGQALVGLLKNYARTVGMHKKAITVGVVGFPNVGKSSIINSLKRARAVQVGSTPGLTKAVQTVKLDKTISLVDSPGVLFDSGQDATLVLRNCIRVEQLDDPAGAVQNILDRVHHEKLMQLYNIARFTDCDDFLGLLALKMGKLGKGGVPNLVLAARQVLEDWNSNKIPFYTVPPEQKDVVVSEFVSQWSSEFKLNEFEANSAREVNLMEDMRPSVETKYVVLAPGEAAAMMADSDVEDDNADMDQKASSRPHTRPVVMGGPQDNARLRKQQKQQRKARAKALRQDANAMEDEAMVDEETGDQDQDQDQLALQRLQQMQLAQAQATDDYDFASDWQ